MPCQKLKIHNNYLNCCHKFRKMATIHIQKSKNLNENYADVPIHLMPCTIHADCDAKVKDYFNPCIKQDDNGVLLATFRGYPLKGAKVEFPENYKGIVLHESIKPVTENQERKFYVTHEFNSFTYWNWDKNPTKNDMIHQALDWIDIAEALHAPITEE